MKKLLFSLIFCFVGFAAEAAENKFDPGGLPCEPHQPNWRLEIVHAYSHGAPQSVLFYEPAAEADEQPVKEVGFYENGQIQFEMDVAVVDEDAPAALEWGSNIVPNGARVEFSPQGELLKISNYKFGKLQGECRYFYPNGKVERVVSYAGGEVVGSIRVFYEDGKIKEEAPNKKGQLAGDVVQYYPNGAKAAVIPHQEGKPHGLVVEWYPSGALKSQRQFFQGLLHGDGKNPAMISYDEKRNILEVVDFREGQPVGMHIRYHANGKESYRLSYKNGKKEGKEQFFSEEGVLLGEGLFQKGRAIGRHYREYANGNLAYLAEFDGEGTLLEPIAEFNEDGQKIRQFFSQGDKLEGAYLEWYPDGTPKLERQYIEGRMDGEQREYFPSGHLKVCAHYKNDQHDGLHEEWHENGVLARKAHFHEVKKEGQMGEWYPNGNSKLDAYFLADQPDGVQTEWHENGQLKVRAEFALGQKQGWQREWNETGAPIFEAFFDRGQAEGTMITWWEADRIKTRFHFAKGKKTGKHEGFFKNGNLERVSFS